MSQPSNPNTTNTTNITIKYLYVVFLMLVLGAATVLGILYIRPNADPVIVIGVVFATIVSTTSSLLLAIKLQQTKEAVNGTIHDFMERATKNSFREGVDFAREQAWQDKNPAVKLPLKEENPDR